jgi:ADP-ribose pyrophosphatase YjhB (NUDIX family)
MPAVAMATWAAMVVVKEDCKKGSVQILLVKKGVAKQPGYSWMFPSGKTVRYESPRDTAIRACRAECGLRSMERDVGNLTVVFSCSTDHTVQNLQCARGPGPGP